MKKKLFRQEVLDNIQSIYDTRENITALPIGIKLILIVLTASFIMFGIWVFRGNIRQSVSVSGIIYSKNGMFSIHAEEPCVVLDVLIKRGDFVQAGDVIGVISISTQNIESHVVRTHKGGMITSVCQEGSVIAAGEILADMIVLNSESNDRIVYAFVPADHINSVKPGLKAQINLQFASREKYGYIEGYVSDIEAYGVPGDLLAQSFNHVVRDLVDNDGVYYTVQITLLPDYSSSNGLRYSNPQGANLAIEVGMRCEADIIYRSVHPYEWLFNRR